MKVLLFVRSLETGGSQRQLAMLANGLLRRSHEVAVVTFYSGGMIEAAMRASGVRVTSVEKTGRWHVITPLAKLMRLIWREQPDLIYTFLPTQSAIAALVLPPWRSTRLVFGIRAGRMEFEQYDSLSSLSYRLEAWLSGRADLIVANGRSVRTDAIARGFPEERIAVIPNGIDISAMRPNPEEGLALRRSWGVAEDEFLIGMVARLDPMKDHKTFLAAAALFAGSNPKSRFVCVGDGPRGYRDELAECANTLGIGAQVIWAGDQEHVRATYNAFDIATLSSAFGEGFPNVIGEAMACGRPVVATDVGESRLIVGDYGEVVPIRRPDLLSEAWASVRRRLEREGNLVDAVRNRIVEQFSAETMVNRSEKALLALCAGEAADRIANEFI